MFKVNNRVEDLVNVTGYKTFVSSIRIVLSLLIAAILLALMGGVVKTFCDLPLFLHAELEEAIRRLILNVLALLAVVEVFRTALAYFTEGRVKVTYVVDTILVVLLTEVMALWFREAEQGRVLVLASLIGILAVVRVLAIKVSPTEKQENEGL